MNANTFRYCWRHSEWGWALLAVAAFWTANLGPTTAPLMVVYVFALIQVAQAERWRLAFYPGLAVGLVIGATNLTFFWTIFSGGAAALWLVFAIWIAAFTAAARFCLRAHGRWGWLMLPVLWMGIEYFRSELYPLKFSWLSPSYGLSHGLGGGWVGWLGVYGVGMVICALAVAAATLWRSRIVAGVGMLAMSMVLLGAPSFFPTDSVIAKGKTVKVAGVQLEFPSEDEVLTRLDALMRRHPEVELVVLPEYTLGEAPSTTLKDWCHTQRVHLVVGGKDPAPANFFNTAYVISPEGEVVFKQVKSVPIQFFKDGLPATRQDLWDSPWGKIGICICYDLSYTRVTDRLAQLGAQALLVPTMDVVDWGKRQHEQHGRIAPARAQEYGVPIFRLASSGISQNVDAVGKVQSSAPFPGQGELLLGELVLGSKAKLPFDRWAAPLATGLTLVFIGSGIAQRRSARRLAAWGSNEQKVPDELPVHS
jgi:apolipoprotein N-acyltransferase